MDGIHASRVSRNARDVLLTIYANIKIKPMYSNNRENYRKAFAETWQKHIKKLPLDAVETDIVAIMIMHPEYRYLLDSNSVNTTEFEPEENPFIHMSLHIALREQIRINRPDGIAAI